MRTLSFLANYCENPHDAASVSPMLFAKEVMSKKASEQVGILSLFLMNYHDTLHYATGVS